MSTRSRLHAMAALWLVALAIGPAHADEGMWTFDNFPAGLMKQRHGVEITPAWLDRVRTATIRLSNCTASFVSGEGLILTNHHCVDECLAEHSSASLDLREGGYLAKARDEEIRCATQYADVLMKMEDITGQVTAAIAGKDEQAANEARKQALTQLEQACEKAAGTRDPRRCEAVRLYEGGQYFLYQYKRYNDVRLVMAPEEDVANFGGDPDNFQFPRWCLDFSLLRAYENGRPASTPGHLTINWSGPAEGEAVFVTGHPGSTNRQLTVAQLEALRSELALWLLRAAELRGRFLQFAKQGAEQARIAGAELFGLENGIKVYRKELDALLDPALMQTKRTDEAALRARTKLPAGEDPWKDIERAAAREVELHVRHTFLEGSAGFDSTLYRYARTLVRGAAERTRPNDARLREYVDTALPLIVQRLTAAVPVYPEAERLTLSTSLERMREFLGPDHPLVRNLLAEFTPDALANALVSRTTLADPEVRKRLWEGGQAAIDASDDPMIRIARLVDPEARAIRKLYEDEVEAVSEAASAKIAAARFAAYGTSVYPDATFTLRLNDGTVQGWNEAGKPVAPFTMLARAFERTTGDEPFRMPASWLRLRETLDPATPFNLVTSNDIVGGNSGSPLVNARGEIVGLVFDGNIHSISGAYWFDAARNRTVAVHPAIMRLALTKVYDAGYIARELGL